MAIVTHCTAPCGNVKAPLPPAGYPPVYTPTVMTSTTKK